MYPVESDGGTRAKDEDIKNEYEWTHMHIYFFNLIHV